MEELERKVLELNEHQQMVHKHMGKKKRQSSVTCSQTDLWILNIAFNFPGEDEEKNRLLVQLQEKSSQVAQLEKQVGDLQRALEPGEEGGSRDRERLQVRST